MAQLTIRILQNGKPLQGAEVTVGEKAHAMTNASGEVKKSVPNDFQPIAASIIVTAPGVAFGGGPYLIEKDMPLTIEV